MVISGVKCNKCKQVVYSRARHDFHWCSCGHVAVDGGQEDYTRVIGSDWSPVDFEMNVSLKRLVNDWKYGTDEFGWATEEEVMP